MKLFFKATFIREEPLISSKLESQDLSNLRPIHFNQVPTPSTNLIRPILERFPFVPSLPHHHDSLDYNFLQLKFLSGKTFVSKMKRMEDDYYRMKLDHARHKASHLWILHQRFLREIEAELETFRRIEDERLKADFHLKQILAQRTFKSKKLEDISFQALHEAADWYEEKLVDLKNRYKMELTSWRKNSDLSDYADEWFQHSAKISLLSALAAFRAKTSTRLGTALIKTSGDLRLEAGGFEPNRNFMSQNDDLFFDKTAWERSIFEGKIFDERFWTDLNRLPDVSKGRSSHHFSIPGTWKASAGGIQIQSPDAPLAPGEKANDLGADLTYQSRAADLSRNGSFLAYSLLQTQNTSPYFSQNTFQDQPKGEDQQPGEILGSYTGALSRTGIVLGVESAPKSPPTESHNPMGTFSRHHWNSDGPAELFYNGEAEAQCLKKKLDDTSGLIPAPKFLSDFSTPLLTSYGKSDIKARPQKERDHLERSSGSSAGRLPSYPQTREPMVNGGPNPQPMATSFSGNSTKSHSASSDVPSSLAAYSRCLSSHMAHVVPLVEVNWPLAMAKEPAQIGDASSEPSARHKEAPILDQARLKLGQKLEFQGHQVADLGEDLVNSKQFKKKLGP